MGRIPILLTCLDVAACGGDNSTSPSSSSTPNVSGTWTGTGSSRALGSSYSVRIVLAQGSGNTAIINGTWSTSTAAAGSLSSGIITGNAFQWSIFALGGGLHLTGGTVSGSCQYTGTLIVSGNQMRGDYATGVCDRADSGTWTLTKQ